MGKPGEVHVDLSEEQWATVKAALDGEIATLEDENARLRRTRGIIAGLTGTAIEGLAQRVEKAEALTERGKQALRRVRHSLSPNEQAVEAIKSEDPQHSHFTPAARMTRDLTYEVIIALDEAIEEEA